MAILKIAAMLVAILKNQVNNGTLEAERILQEKICIKIRRFNFSPAAILEIAAMLAAILKNHPAHVARSVLKIL